MKKAVFLVPILGMALAGCNGAPPDADTQAQVASSEKRTVLGRAMDKGEGVATTSNILQINQILGMVKGDNEGKTPATLEEAKVACKGVTPEMWVDAATGKPLVYDPTTGTVSRAP